MSDKLTKDYKTFLLSSPLASDDSDDPDYFVDSSNHNLLRSPRILHSILNLLSLLNQKKNLLNNIWVIVMDKCKQNQKVRSEEHTSELQSR